MRSQSEIYSTWWDQAACKNHPNPIIFFPHQGQSDQLAKQVCGTCEVTVDCLTFAVTHHEIGIWGGTTERERRRKRRAA